MGMTQHNIGNVWDYAIFIHLFSPGVNDFEQSSKYVYFDDDDDDASDPW